MSGQLLDLAVVGAGPCGIAVGIAARQLGLECLLFDKGAVTQAMIEHPTYTTYFSGPEKLEIGGVPFTTAGDKPTRREALRYYRKVVAFFGLSVCQYEEVVQIDGGYPELLVHTRTMHGEEREYRCRNVVIATGYYHTPRRLDVPGARQPRHRLPPKTEGPCSSSGH